jgi:hypothetical protein
MYWNMSGRAKADQPLRRSYDATQTDPMIWANPFPLTDGAALLNCWMSKVPTRMQPQLRMPGVVGTSLA